MKVAIIIMETNRISTFDTFFRKSLQNYCDVNKYELIVLDKALDGCADSGKKFFWQRMLLPSVYNEYDYVISMDSDIYISPNAPAIPFDEIPEGKIAAINERKYFGNYEWREGVQIKNGWEKTGRDWHMLSGFDRKYNDHINGGLVVYQPKYHADIFKKLYYDNIENYMRYHQDDQSIISVFGIDNNLIHWLDERFNRIWSFWRDIMYPGFDSLSDDLKRVYVKNFIELNYFTHFTGRTDIQYLPKL
jgi:hypothetical protein